MNVPAEIGKARAATPTPAPLRVVPSAPQIFSLRQLRRADENVRHTRVDEDIAGLADDIAAHGLLQSLIGYKAGKLVHIVGGGRRFQALREIENRGLIGGEFPVPVLIRDVEEAVELSLAENLQQRTMSPVDEFFAFKALIDTGHHSPAGLAKRFGFSERVVKQRLRLAEVEPEVLDALAHRSITLDAAMAYASSQDRALQREVFRTEAKRLRKAHQPDSIRHSLQLKGQRTDSPLFRFVGAEAYEAAGGRYEDDLFHEGSAGKLLTNPALLQGLADELVDRRMEQLLPEWRARKDLSPTIVGYLKTPDLRLFSYGTPATFKAPDGFVRVEKHDWAPMWRTIRNNRVDVHLVVGIDDQGQLNSWPRIAFVPKDQQRAVAPPAQAPTSPQLTPEQEAAAARRREIDRRSRRLAVGSFAGTPFEGRVFFPAQVHDHTRPFELYGEPGYVVTAEIFVTDAAIAAAMPEAVEIYEQAMVEQAERERAGQAQADADEKRWTQLRAMDPAPEVIVIDGAAYARNETGGYAPVTDDGPNYPDWESLLDFSDISDIGEHFATRADFDAVMAALDGAA